MKPLERMEKRARHDPFFLGWALNQYQRHHGMDETTLSELLECEQDRLVSLSLCRSPDDQVQEFMRHVRLIAEYVQCNPDRLASLLREVAVVVSLRETPLVLDDGLLMAARDRQEDQDGKDEPLEEDDSEQDGDDE